MIKIQKYSEVSPDFFSGRNFTGTIESVQTVLNDVKSRGNAALKEYSEKFDKIPLENFEVSQETLKKAADKMKAENKALFDAISYSYELCFRFAKKQKECFTDFEVELEPGLFTGQKNIAVEKAGVYVPAGRFPLVSTVVMTVTPAKAAGAREIVLCTPPRVNPDGSSAPYADENIMAAAYICGATKVFALGGAQAIAAMAFGTETVPKVDVIVGPGNKFVAEAKRLVYGTVGIDMVAGPTEVFIIADESANPAWVAADLLAQAEHDVVAQPILATTSKKLADEVAAEIEKQLATLSTFETASKSIENCGLIILCDSLDEAAEAANRKAPEHLELAMDSGAERDRIAALCHNYGSLFLGHGSAEVFGDYAAGLNHTLPTSSSARFTGGLSVRVFLKTVTTLRTVSGSSGVLKSAQTAAVLGDAEGLAAHARAARIRLE